MRYTLFILLFMISIACYATIYMQIDKQGNASYSDIPLGNNSQVIDITQSNQTTSVKPTPPQGTTPVSTSTETPTDNSAAAKKPYTTFIITYPGDNETIQNQPTFPVEIKIDPALQAGDKIQLFVDNKPTGDALASPHLQLSLIDRGTHTLYAIVFDENQKALKRSPANTIFVHQATSLFTPPGAQKASPP